MNDSKMWPDDEVTTRNCFHCKTTHRGKKIYCAQGHDLGDLSLKQVIGRKQLYSPCNKCKDIDCNWK